MSPRGDIWTYPGNLHRRLIFRIEAVGPMLADHVLGVDRPGSQHLGDIRPEKVSTKQEALDREALVANSCRRRISSQGFA